MTPFTDIYDLAKVTIIDYKIDALIQADYNAFLTYFRSLLTIGIPEFTGCLDSLEYTSKIETNENNEEVVNWYFVRDLDIYEKSILSKTMVLKWWDTQLQDVRAFQPHLSTKNFKQLQESQSLKQKTEYKGALEEDISKAITAYQLNNLNKLPFFGGDS
jgi:hypothetical protein